MGFNFMEDSWIFTKKNINIPNFISFIRIILIVPFVLFMLSDDYFSAGIILAVSGLSDIFDGYIARHFNQITKLGSMLDPVSDKLTLLAVMSCVALKFPCIVPFMVILMLKEISMLTAGIFLLKNHKFPPKAQWYGKIATFSFYISVIIIVSVKAFFNLESKWLSVGSMSVTLCLMLFALIKYCQVFFDIIK